MTILARLLTLTLLAPATVVDLLRRLMAIVRMGVDVNRDNMVGGNPELSLDVMRGTTLHLSAPLR